MRVLDAAFPASIQMGDMENFSAEKLRDVATHAPHIRWILEVAGTPCQNVSGANATRQVLRGEKSNLFFFLEHLAKEYEKAFP